MRLSFSSLIAICLVKYIFANDAQSKVVNVESEDKASPRIRVGGLYNHQDEKRHLQAFDVVQIADVSYDEPPGDYHDTENSYHHETTIPEYHHVHTSKEVEEHPVVAVNISKEEHYNNIPAKEKHVLHSEKIEEYHPKPLKGKHYDQIHRHHKKKGSYIKAKGKEIAAKDTYVVAPHYHHHTHINVNEPEEEEEEEEEDKHHHKHFRGKYHWHKSKGKRSKAHYKSTDDDVNVPKKKGWRHKYHQVVHHIHSDDFMAGFRAGYHYGRYYGKLHGEYEYDH